MQNQIEAEPEYQMMIKKNRFCTLKLCKLIKKIVNGSTVVIVEDVIGNMIEALFNFALIRGEEYEGLPQCLQAFHHRFKALADSGFSIAHDQLRDKHIGELQSRGQSNTEACKALINWKNADPANTMDIKAGQDMLSEAVKSRSHIKRSGKDFEQCHREMSNSCIGQSREYPHDVTEANHQLEYHRSMHSAKRKTDEGGEQHLLDGKGGDKACQCFRCGRTKPECNGARSCNYPKKVDGTEVNSKEVIEALFQEQKDAKKNRRKEIGGSQHMIDGVIVPEWTDELDEEKSHDGNMLVE